MIAILKYISISCCVLLAFTFVVGNAIVFENQVTNGDYIIQPGDTLVLRGKNIITGSLIVSKGAALTVDTNVNTNLQVGNIDVYGNFFIGSDLNRYSKKAIFDLACNSTYPSPDERRKSIVVRSGASISLYGRKASTLSWTKLNATAQKGSQCLSLAEVSDEWEIGDEIVIASTDFDPHQAEKRKIIGFNDSRYPGCNLVLNEPLKFSHYGRISEGVDQRGEVGLLTRNIVFRGCQETTPGFEEVGTHMMFYAGFQQVHLLAVELQNVGQGDQIGRYPLHFHVAHRVPAGTFLRQNSIHYSHFRAITIHGTQNVLVEGNVAYNITGHAVMLEDGAETDNVFEKNLIVLVKEKKTLARLGSDTVIALSGFYITNADNTFIDNVIAGVEGSGFWIHTRLKVKALSYASGLYDDVFPYLSNLKVMRGNVVHSSKYGLRIESPDLDGDDTPRQTIFPSPSYTWSPKEMPVFRNFTIYHCRQGGWFRLYRVVVDGWIIADVTEGLQVLTQGNTGNILMENYIQNSLFVGGSSNRGNLVEGPWQFINLLEARSDSAADRTDDSRVGIKLYDGPLYMKNNTFTHWYSQDCLQYINPAIGARLFNTFAMTTATSSERMTFDDKTLYRLHISDRMADGGKTTSVKDLDGTLGGLANGIIFPSWDFYNTSECIKGVYYGISCPHIYTNFDIVSVDNSNDPAKYGQLVVHRNNFDLSTQQQAPNLVFDGQYIPSQSGWLYHPQLSKGASYTFNYLKRTPNRIDFTASNGEKGYQFELFIVFPPETQLIRIENQANIAWKNVASSFLDASCTNCYFYDSTLNTLKIQLTLLQDRPQTYGDACPQNGCEEVHVFVNAPQNAGVSTDYVQKNIIPIVRKKEATQTSWLNTKFLQESAPALDSADNTDWCQIGDECLQQVDTGNRRIGILAYHDNNCVGIGCFSSTCRYCKLSISIAQVPFVPCPFDPYRSSNNATTATISPSTDLAPAIAPGPCSIYMSVGDLAVGISAAYDSNCRDGGLGCVNQQCRFCKTRETQQSKAFVLCSSILLSSATVSTTNTSTSLLNASLSIQPVTPSLSPSPASNTLAPISLQPTKPIPLTISPAAATLADSTKVPITPAPTTPTTLLAPVTKVPTSSAAASTTTPTTPTLTSVPVPNARSSIPAVPSASALATPKPLTAAPVPKPTLAVPKTSSPLLDECALLVSVGDSVSGISAYKDTACNSGSLGCFSLKCRFCKTRNTLQSQHFLPCITATSFESSLYESTPSIQQGNTSDSCWSYTSLGDAQAGIATVTDTSCEEGGLGCLTKQCRFCKVANMTHSAHLLTCDQAMLLASKRLNEETKPHDVCRGLVSSGDIAVGITAVTDDCSSGGLGCIGNSCRFCKNRETKQSQHFYDCSKVNSTFYSLPIYSGDNCGANVSKKDTAAGIYAFTDHSCTDSDKTCLSSTCRYCSTPYSDNSDKFLPCPKALQISTQAEEEVTPISDVNCASFVSFGDSRLGISATKDSSCSSGDAGCFARFSCRFCKYLDTEGSASFIECPFVSTQILVDNTLPEPFTGAYQTKTDI